MTLATFTLKWQNKTSNYLRAECNGYVGKFDYVEGWQDAMRAWKKDVGLESGSKLTIYHMVDAGCVGRYTSTIS